MESIGEKFRSLREARNLTIRMVCNDTNISPHYLEALENEDFDHFPSETYITGFIRSYAEYLKTDPEEIIRAYKGYKIGESVTPLEELTKPTSSGLDINSEAFAKGLKYFVIILFGVLIIGGGSFAVKNFMSSKIDVTRDDSIDEIKEEEAEESSKQSEHEQIRNLKLSGNKGFVLAYTSEAVKFLVDSKECTFVVESVGVDEAVVEILPVKQKVTLILDRSIPVTFKNTSREVYLTLRGYTENRAKIMVTLGGKLEDDRALADGEEVSDPKEALAVSTQVRATDKSNLKIVFEAIFLSKTYLEIYLDGNMKTRGIIQAGAREVWEANEYIQIKIGNAGGMKAKINGELYEFGLAGQVANKVITWKKDPNDPNLYNIVVNDW
ncbi:MAG: helix-turn-helix domain-containing protein [Spirochaetes bacterium]|nr:helix-turn-helix domain-containing protein [Spirochaetota bacterium]MBN2771624.1 helix-turn-helix domain-containing protein [Spirochaetota bacterium]